MRQKASRKWKDPFVDVKFNHVLDPNGDSIPGQVGVYLYDPDLVAKKFPYRLVKMVAESYNLITNATAKEAGELCLKATGRKWEPLRMHKPRKSKEQPSSYWFNGYMYLQDYTSEINEDWRLGFRVRNSYDGHCHLSFQCYVWNTKIKGAVYDTERFIDKRIKHVAGQVVDPEEEGEKILKYFDLAQKTIDDLYEYSDTPLDINTMMSLLRSNGIYIPRTLYSTIILSTPKKDATLLDFFLAVCHTLTYGSRTYEAASRKVFKWLKQQPTQKSPKN